MKGLVKIAALATLLLGFAFSALAEEGRLNFMLINLTGQDITDVRICPTYYPQYQSENLLRNALAPEHHIYIGPNYYGEQIFWNIAVKWANGHEQTFSKLRLTRYNTYTVYSTPQGIRIRQTFDPQNARYAFGPEAPSYMGAKPEVKVAATSPKKLNAALALAVDMNAEPGKKADAQADKLAFGAQDRISDKAMAIKTTAEVTRAGKNMAVNPKGEFKAGDKIRLRFTTNRDGHVYWVKKDGESNYHILYPTAQDGSGVSGNRIYTIPASEPLQFDGSAETLFAILSPTDVTDLAKAAKLQAEGKFTEASKLIAALVDRHEQQKNTNTVIIEEEDEDDVNMQSQLADGEFVGEYEIGGE
ncbi:MAG: DUF4384 domain-containing protein [Desulfovibrio sp.]|nr:DUF4384 domain-containing protein [Desulfovibrio sp.]